MASTSAAKVGFCLRKLGRLLLAASVPAVWVGCAAMASGLVLHGAKSINASFTMWLVNLLYIVTKLIGLNFVYHMVTNVWATHYQFWAEQVQWVSKLVGKM